MIDKNIKLAIMNLAIAELELMLSIVGNMGSVGYKAVILRLHGASLGQCASRLKISKGAAQHHWRKCRINGYDVHLRRMLKIPESKKSVS